MFNVLRTQTKMLKGEDFVNVKYISQERLDAIRKFLESKDSSELPHDISRIMWRARDLYTSDEGKPEIYLTKTRNYREDIIVQFDDNGSIKCFIIANDYTNDFWSLT